MKASKKEKELIFRIHPKMFGCGIPANIKRRVKKEVKKELKDIKYHFKKDGWALDKRLIEDDIINRVIGSQDIFAYIDALLLQGLGEGYVISYGYNADKNDREMDAIRRANDEDRNMGILVRSLFRDSKKKSKKGK